MNDARAFGLIDRLDRLADALDAVDLRGARYADETIPAERDRLAAVIRNYLLPRASAPDAPLLVVFAGPTGAGKSTLVNSLSGLDLTPVGVVRPTTARPLVLTGGPGVDDRVAVEGVSCEVVVGNAPILGHMTFVDTPDVDSTSTGHRAVAEMFIDRADIVVFVTSAIRYADDVPWEVLRRAASRGATVIPVMNRVGPGSAGVVTDFARKLRAAGIDGVPVRVPEHHLASGAQRIPLPAVRTLRRRLFGVAKAQRDHRAEVLNRVLNATTRQVGDLTGRISDLSDQLAALGARMERAIGRAPAMVPDPGREWASLPTEGPPTEPKPLARWRRRVQRRGTEGWVDRLVAGLVAELETRLRSDLIRHAQPVVAETGVAALGLGAAQVLEDAVRSWSALVLRISEAADVGSGGHEVLLSAVLAGGDGSVLRALFDNTAADRVVQARRDLEGRLAVIWGHFAARVAEVWSTMTGRPDGRAVEALVAEVAASYQFADA